MIDYEVVLRFILVLAAGWHLLIGFAVTDAGVSMGVGMLTRFLGRNDCRTSNYD